MEKVIFNTRRQDFFNSLSENEFVFLDTEIKTKNEFFRTDSINEPSPRHSEVVELRSYVEEQRKRNERNKRIWELKSTIIRLETELKKREEFDRIRREEELERQEKLKVLGKNPEEDSIRKVRNIKRKTALQEIEAREIERRKALELRELERRGIIKESLKARLAKQEALKLEKELAEKALKKTDQDLIDDKMNNSSLNLIDKVKLFMSSNDFNYYLGLGGLGDAILLLATCWEDPKARVIYFANHQPFIKQFFALFDVKVFISNNIMGDPVSGPIYDFVTQHPNFKQSAHLAEGLYHGDWRNESKYIPRIPKYVPWAEKFGAIRYPEPVLILAPAGSSRDEGRKRYLEVGEYRNLANKYLDLGYRVFGSGSSGDFHHYGNIDRQNFHWLAGDRIYNHDGTSEPSDLLKMLRIINGATQLIAVDTWIKSYTLLCNIPTTVIKTRWSGNYLPYGEDVTDFIFLNPNIWPNIRMEKIENLI